MSDHDNATCDACGKPFTKQEWDERHWGPYGEEWHEACCPVCQADDDEAVGGTVARDMESDTLPR